MGGRRIIAEWLFIMAGLLIVMTLLGGVTRLTDSGLSITEWAPITGIIPPLTQAGWDEAFAAYRQIPQYKALNPSMTLAAFKTIYWWEWGHRAFGRLIGIAFLLPFLFFLSRRWIPPIYIAQFVCIFMLGALQGLVGWLMVQSGLTARVDVSPLRLMVHLGLAVLIYGWVVMLALRFWHMPEGRPPSERSFVALLGGLLLALIFVQILLGALVSGSDAGLLHNQWPGMGGQADLTARLDNPAFIQWLHRLGAWLLFGVSGFYVLFCWLYAPRPVLFHSALILFATIVIQAGLGILTLIYVVPIFLALSHQLGGLLVWTAALVHIHLAQNLPKNRLFSASKLNTFHY